MSDSIENSNLESKNNTDQRSTWTQALVTFFGPFFLIFLIRWLLVEPFVIPSGSMIPNLLIHDHILVNKLSFGINKPWLKGHLLNWSKPKHGDIVVFRYPENPEVYFIKRVIGLPGETVEIKQGQVFINDQPALLDSMHGASVISADIQNDFTKSFKESDLNSNNQDADVTDTFHQEFNYYSEQLPNSDKKHVVRYINKESSDFAKFIIPKNSFFMMGDNRDQSNDSRVWGVVPIENLIGSAFLIWLSCDQTLPSADFICNPQTIRWPRILKIIR